MRTGLASLGVVAVSAVAWTVWSAEEPSRDIYTEDEHWAGQCRKQMLVVKEALWAYRDAHEGQWPSRLSELVPGQLGDKRFLMCPYVRDAGVYVEWRRGIRGDVFPEPEIASYAYEFCDQPLEVLRNQGLTNTVRDYKQRQVKLLESRRVGAGDQVPVVRCLAHRPFLNLSLGGRLFTSPLEWEELHAEVADHAELVPEALFAEELEAVRLKHLRIPPRPEGLSARLVDLTEHYNASLTEPMHGGAKGNDLSELKSGEAPVELKGVRYDVRGIVQLKGRELASYPQERTGIRVGQSCEKLHFLHATAYAVPTNTVIGHYRVRYADGTVKSIPVVYGKDVLDWWVDPKDAVAARLCDIAWEGGNPVTRNNARVVRLYHTVWKNPFPLESIRSLDFVSEVTLSAPFLLAVTLE
jgi:hypothetical protein